MRSPPPFSLAASLQQARKLLGLVADENPLTKSCIQNAYIRGAKLHHPDARHGSSDKASKIHGAIQFNRCKEARDLLLFHHCHIGKRINLTYRKPTTSDSESARYHQQQEQLRRHEQSSKKGWFAGFPSRQMRLFSLKANFFLRSVVISVTIFGTLYSEWYDNKPLTHDCVDHNEPSNNTTTIGCDMKKL
mmetsp:Transcript_34179/g.39602  ORF Transcript_34179/g.39602 Transcript_34179/m.39602 type:complete len:190 (+) Transcript_34179:31-600(+)